MSYPVKFRSDALKEWNNLSKGLQIQFANKLRECVANTESLSTNLREIPNCYKIQLRAYGYSLIYQILGDAVVIAVIAIGKRDLGEISHLPSKSLR